MHRSVVCRLVWQWDLYRKQGNVSKENRREKNERKEMDRIIFMCYHMFQPYAWRMLTERRNGSRARWRRESISRGK